MVTLDDRLRRNEDEIAAKVMDGEAIIINLVSGVYYRMDEVGGAIWAMIEDGRSLGEMVTTLTEQYEVSRDQAQTDVERLATELLREKLVSASDDTPQAEQRQVAKPQRRLSYEPPVLNVYRDMGDLLALDPPVPVFKDIPQH